MRRDVGGRHLRRGAAAEEGERVLGLVAQELEHLPDAGVSAVGEPVHHRPPDEDGAGAERERGDDVASAPNAAVDVDLGPSADGLDDLGQRVQAGDRAVELPAAVVRDDDRGGAVLASEDARPRR